MLGLEPGPLDPETSTLTMRPFRTFLKRFKVLLEKGFLKSPNRRHSSQVKVSDHAAAISSPQFVYAFDLCFEGFTPGSSAFIPSNQKQQQQQHSELNSAWINTQFLCVNELHFTSSVFTDIWLKIIHFAGNPTCLLRGLINFKRCCKGIL